MHGEFHGFWPVFPLMWVAFLVILFSVIRRVVAHRRCGGYGYGGAPWMRQGHGPWGHQGQGWQQGQGQGQGLSAIDVLCMRYARGEIDAVTFDQMRERIEGAQGGRRGYEEGPRG